VEIKKLVLKIKKEELSLGIFESNLESKLDKYWANFRIKFFYDYLKHVGTLTPKSEFENLGGWNLFKYLFHIIFNSSLIRLLFGKYDYLILGSSRGKLVDPYSDDISRSLGKSQITLAQSNTRDYYKKVVYIDMIKIFAKIYAQLACILKPSSRRKIPQELFARFDDIPQEKFVAKFIKSSYEFDFMYKMYSCILRRMKVKQVFVVVGYYNLPLIIAARNLGIKTTEIQHGVVTPYHISYSFNEGALKKYCFADNLFTMGEYWGRACLLPRDVVVNNVGNNYFVCDKAKSINKDNRKILFISQTTIFEHIVEFINVNLDTLSEYELIFKLHPNEFSRKEYIVNTLMTSEWSGLNLTVVTTQNTLSELQDFCAIQIGIYSTGIFEGLQKGCFTLIIPGPGISYLEDLIKRQLVRFYDDKVELSTQLNSFQKNIGMRFFEKFSVSKLNRMVVND